MSSFESFVNRRGFLGKSAAAIAALTAALWGTSAPVSACVESEGCCLCQGSDEMCTYGACDNVFFACNWIWDNCFECLDCDWESQGMCSSDICSNHNGGEPLVCC